MSNGPRPPTADVREGEARDERHDRDHREQQVGIDARIRPWHIATVALGSLALAVVTGHLAVWAVAAATGAMAGAVAASWRQR